MMLVTANIFQPLIDVFESVLKGIHSGGFSWGLSIVLLTLAVRAVLVPLTFRQIKGMVRMQALQPQMKEIQQKYKEDKQRQQQEIMKFYRENNVNPLSSCLPMVLQIPVFIALYYMLRESLRNDICHATQVAYRIRYAAKHPHISHAALLSQTTACGSTHGHNGAAFLFISDLTAKGTGVELIILILLYVGSQLGSTLVMSASSTMDPTQRKIMLFMPLIFVLFVIRFPAGLMLYWITTNLWTVAQQYVVRRYIGPTTAVAGGGADADGGGGLGSRVLPRGGGGGAGASAGGGGFGERIRERLERAQSDAAAKGSASAKGGAASGKSGTGTASSAKSSSGKTATAKRPAPAKSGGSGANGSGGGGSAPPPRPPRKKKKRSGRRR